MQTPSASRQHCPAGHRVNIFYGHFGTQDIICFIIDFPSGLLINCEQTSWEHSSEGDVCHASACELRLCVK